MNVEQKLFHFYVSTHLVCVVRMVLSMDHHLLIAMMLEIMCVNQSGEKLLETIGEPPLPDCSSFTDEGLVCNLPECEFYNRIYIYIIIFVMQT